MSTFLTWFVAAVVAMLLIVGLFSSLVLSRMRRLFDDAVNDMTAATYTQTGGLRDALKGHLDEQTDHIVERVDSAANAQHEQTRRALEYSPAYTGSGSTALPLPTAADAQAAADAYLRAVQASNAANGAVAPPSGPVTGPSVNAAATGAQGARRGRQAPERPPWDYAAGGYTGGAPSAPPPPPRQAEQAYGNPYASAPTVRRPNTAAALIGDQLGDEYAARQARETESGNRWETPPTEVDRRPERPSRHRLTDDRGRDRRL